VSYYTDDTGQHGDDEREERENARAAYERGWRDGAEAMRKVFLGETCHRMLFEMLSRFVLPEPPKEEADE
jgi:hypothetical protein